MKMPISEIIDRYTITKLKSERTTENVVEELSCYEKEIESYGCDFSKYIDRMYEVNSIIWNLEGGIRRGDDIPLEEVGRLAIQVRDYNKKRNGIKAELIDKFAEGFKEIKVNYTKVNYGDRD